MDSWPRGPMDPVAPWPVRPFSWTIACRGSWAHYRGPVGRGPILVGSFLWALNCFSIKYLICFNLIVDLSLN